MTPTRVLFRVDASQVLASGHTMRCLTLAQALAANGVVCRFACRALEGNMVEHIRSAGFDVATLPCPPAGSPQGVDPRLGVSEADDARDTVVALAGWRPNWIIVDHYALAQVWETEMHAQCDQLMAIDDYTDRPHACDVLLNQNLGVSADDYALGLLPEGCKVVAGTDYALLRPEFARARPQALKRRQEHTTSGHILVTMGGVDPNNMTGQVLAILASCQLPESWHVTAVMGGQAPHLAMVRAQAATQPFKVRLIVNTTEMERLMTEADFAIGAAGSTSWERCALGLPSIVLVLADNQIPLARALVDAGAALGAEPSDPATLRAAITRLVGDRSLRIAMAAIAATLVDGHGTGRVVEVMNRLHTTSSERLHNGRPHL